MIEAVLVVLLVTGVVSGWGRLVRSLVNGRGVSLRTAKVVSTAVWVVGLLFGIGGLIAITFGIYSTWKLMLNVVKESKRNQPAAQVSTRFGPRPFDVIRFEYRGREDYAHLQRTVEVTGVNDTYFEGMCRARQGERTFRLDRVRGEVVSLETGEIFQSASAWRDAHIHDARNLGVSPVPQDTWKRDR